MNKKLNDLLDSRGGNYILPFFWQHGENEAVLREEMAKIDECGIGAVCVEARPHPDYAGPGWWHDMDIIFDEARTRGMTVWILDDAHFPTGFANGQLKNKPDELRKQYVMVKSVDTCGPIKAASLDIGKQVLTMGMPPIGESSSWAPEDQRLFNDDSILAVVAAPMLEDDRILTERWIDLSDFIDKNHLVWDVPGGLWRIFILYLTRNGGGDINYINMIDRDSCAVQIETVYEPHYIHYKADFGKTFAGFFSDEPCIGNTVGYNFDESIGKMMPLPWNADMPVLLEQAMGKDWQKLLPLLWFKGDLSSPTTAHVRYAYMDIVTRLIERNFSHQLGKWCSAHGVEYIGHIIEDENQHSKLGCSMGHFFRSMAGQHMSGIDDIGTQVLPGQESNIRHGVINRDGEFYHFALGKLGSSLGHIDPLKKGRTMCEIFGAYGWGEGVRMMKWLTDHFLVRGVNYFVPHAFSAKEFPDPDCPPHFYARGQNPQFRHFGQLMRYMNRMCHLLNDGRCVAPAALLYHGESEWTGKTQFLQKPARALTENQIDFDILPSDVFADELAFQTSFTDCRLSVNGNEYRCLIVPTSEYITSAVADFAAKASAAGFPVIFIEELPTGLCDALLTGRKLTNQLADCKVVPLQDLPSLMAALDIFDIRLSKPFKQLRYLHYQQDTDLFMFFNESMSETVDLWVDIPVHGPACFYDAETNTRFRADISETPLGSKLHLTLAPYESRMLIFGCGQDASDLPVYKPLIDLQPQQTVTGPWTISLASATEYPNFRNQHISAELYNIAEKSPLFSGTIRYETSLDIDGIPEAACELVLEEANEAVEAWVNGQYAGMKLCPPYRFSVGPILQSGTNILRIEVTNTLENQMKDQPDMMGVFQLTTFDKPLGLLGKVTVMN